jgi:hypothetical protein
MNSENDRILIIFTISFLHFYTNYDTTLSFDKFYSNELKENFSYFKIDIVDENNFRLFCYSFYQQVEKEFAFYNYNANQEYLTQYNPSVFKEMNNLDENTGNLKNEDTVFGFLTRGYKTILENKLTSMKKRFLTPLISATERVVDAVLSVRKIF